MLFYLESNFKSKPNKRHYSYINAKFHVFDEIHDFIKEKTKIAFFDIFTSFHLENPLSLHSQTLSRVSNIFICLIFFCK